MIAQRWPAMAAARRAWRVDTEWRHSIRFGLLAFLAFRVVTELIVLVALFGAGAPLQVLHDPATALTPWSHWDSYWQIAIAQYGYPPLAHVQGAHFVFSSAAFQPVLPGLMRALSATFGVSPLSAGLLIVSAALAAAAVGLHRLAEMDCGRDVARLAVVLLLVFPSAVFLAAPYAEPLVLAAVVWAFLAMRKGHPLLAGVLIGVAAMTKLVAIVFVVPLLVEAITMAGPKWRARASMALRALVGPACALAGLALFYGAVFHDPLRVLSAEAAWTGRYLAPPWVALANALHPLPSLSVNDAAAIADICCVVLLLPGAVIAWRRLRPSYAVLLGVLALAFTSTTTLVGTSRWTLDAFPLFIAGAVVLRGHRRWRVAAVGVSSIGAALFLWTYAQGGWAG